MNAPRELDALREADVISALDLHFARIMNEISESPLEVLLAAALVSSQTHEGHVCVNLEPHAGTAIMDAEGAETGASWPELGPWQTALRTSRLVGDGSSPTPLVLDDSGRLYLYRYFDHERRVAELLSERLDRPLYCPDPELLSRDLDRFFGPETNVDRQAVAAQVAMVKNLCIITGGPGTGKTSTVVKLLALAQNQAHSAGERTPSVLLLAPTGKAAARLSESVERARARLDLPDDLFVESDTKALTIHRALQPFSGSSTRFRRTADNPLPADIVIVDESSMVDIALMRRLLEAVPPSARIVLLGDRHQLSSVQAGAVLGDLCGRHELPGHSSNLAAHLEKHTGRALPESLRATSVALPPIADCVVELTRSYRFDESSGIASVSNAVRRGEADAVIHLLGAGEFSDVQLLGPPDGMAPGGTLFELSTARYAEHFQHRSAEDALLAFEGFRILCAQRRGPLGAVAINRRIEQALTDKGLAPASQTYYRGRPILVTENNYRLGLFNGDIGLVWVRDDGHGLRAFFPGKDRTLRSVALAELPAHETVFAMSIHKSQGSEFDDIAVVLPEPGSRLLSRELLYTAITRARRSVLLFASQAALRTCIEHPVQRASGLEARLWTT